MKKTIFALLALGAVGSASANTTFTGWFVGAEVNTTKHKFSVPKSSVYAGNSGEYSAKGSHKAGVAVVGGYSFQYGNSDFVGQVEGKIRTGGSKSKLDGQAVSKEKYGASITYVQGYRLNNVMPYLKVSANNSAFTTNDDVLCATNCRIDNQAARGIGYGAGVKYAIDQNVEVGAEYHRANLKGRQGIKLKTETISANAAYRF